MKGCRPGGVGAAATLNGKGISRTGTDGRGGAQREAEIVRRTCAAYRVEYFYSTRIPGSFKSYLSLVRGKKLAYER